MGRPSSARFRPAALACALLLAWPAIAPSQDAQEGPPLVPAGSPLADLAATLQPGQWASLATQNIDPTLTNTGGSSNMIFGYADAMKWDPVSRRALYLGSDHGGHPTPGPDSTFRFVAYAEATNAWSVLPTPPWAMTDPVAGTYSDAHGYDKTALNAAGRRLYRNPFNSKRIHVHDLETGAWSLLPDPPFTGSSCCDAIEYVPELGGVVWSQGTGTQLRFREATQQWSVLGNEPSLASTWMIAEYNPVHRVTLLGSSTRALFELSAAGQLRRLRDIPISIYDGSAWNGVVTVDPVSGDYLALTPPPRQLYSYDVREDTWQLRPTPPPDPAMNAVLGTPIPAYGVVMFTHCNNGGSCGVWLYKHASPAAPSDFDRRCTAPGVIKCVGFDSPADIPDGGGGANFGVFPSSGNPAIRPTLDPGVRASGNSSLRFTIPSLSGADTSGSYFTNFSADLLTQFGENAEFYIQWRQRFTPEFASTHYAGGGGWKQTIVGSGDQPGGVLHFSCSDLEVVTVNGYYRGFVQMYNSCSGSTSHGPFDGFEEPFGAFDFKLENARPAPYCLYSQTHTTPPTSFPPTGNCIPYTPNEWMTFQVHIKTGPRVGDEFRNSHVDFWIAREGQPSQQAFDWGPYHLTAGSPAENQKFGKVWLLPYNTGKNPTVSYPETYTWYDELIISRQPIADPAGGPPPAPLKAYTVRPCRLVDTRGAQAPALGANTVRAFTVTGQCTIPADARALAVNLTAVNPGDPGNLRLYAAGTPTPLASALNFARGRTRANNAIVSVGEGGQVSVRCDMPPGSTAATHVLLDVFAYFK